VSVSKVSLDYITDKTKIMPSEDVSNNNVWVNLKQKQLSMCMEIRFMFVSNQVRYLDHATLAFKLNRIIKKINQTNRL